MACSGCAKRKAAREAARADKAKQLAERQAQLQQQQALRASGK